MYRATPDNEHYLGANRNYEEMARHIHQSHGKAWANDLSLCNKPTILTVGDRTQDQGRTRVCRLMMKVTGTVMALLSTDPNVDSGSNVEYLFEIAKTLREQGLEAQHEHELERQVRAIGSDGDGDGDGGGGGAQ